MRIEGASIPFPAPPCCGPKGPSPIERAIGAPRSADARIESVARLVGATVPGRVTFSAPVEGAEAVASPAIQMYRHPADRNAAATGVHAGRLVDISA